MGCGTVESGEVLTASGVVPDCSPGETYPDGAVEPMALGEVLTPYAWPEAVHRGTGERNALRLANAPCNVDPNIDWSPADVLLFISIPAW